ncbi:MAG TPA: choice-of-anchor Q domain-containing protein, partial [Flavobacteriales bacterium]|nr:choice-of-anchor Q domain-containing protein [Flavobacteriales bacterium]
MNSTVPFFNTVIEGNVAWEAGGAYLFNGSGVVSGCSFISNRALGDDDGFNGRAGALFMNTSRVEDCLFRDNHAYSSGGAISTWSDHITRCRFEDNTARTGGGAVAVYGALSNAAIYECEFLRNRVLLAGRSGGAVEVDFGFGGAWSFRILASRFVGNSAPRDGGAIYFNNAKAVVQSCVFDGNEAGRNGGAIAFFSGVGSCRIINSTFAHNAADSSGQALYDWATYFDSTKVINSICWDHEDTELVKHPNGRPLVITRSDLEGSYTGTALMQTDPLFRDALGVDGIAGTADDDLQLAAGSPCINAGTPDTTGLDLFPIEAAGAPRVVATVDMGAYEYNTCSGGPSPAIAPADTVVCSRDAFYIEAATPTIGVGRWRIIGDGTGSLGAYDVPNATYDPRTRVYVPLGVVQLEWSVTYCGTTSRDTLTIISAPLPDAPMIATAGPLAPCPGEVVELSLVGGGLALWSTGDTLETLPVTANGTYYARAMSDLGCAGALSAPVNIAYAATPPTPNVQVTGSLQLCTGMGQHVTLTSSVSA